MNKKQLLTAGLAVIVIGAAAVLTLRSATPELAVAAVARGPAVEAVYATGTVEPVIMAEVRPVVTGRIAGFEAEEGQHVAAGQTLARLDSGEARARVDELTARAAYWRDELTRQKALAAGGVASQSAFDRAQSEARAANAAVAAAQQKLQDVVVVAPFAGIVLRREGEVGEVVDTKSTLFWIGQERPLRITAEVDEEDIPRLANGQPVLVKADAFPGQALDGRVDRVTPKGDPLTKTFRVRIGLPDETPLLPGMTTELNVVVRQVDQALLVPGSAVVDGHVFVVVDGHARLRPVRAGIVGRRATEIIDGLNEGEVIVAEPPTSLSDGARVRPRPAGS